MQADLILTYEAYGGCVNQRYKGAVEAAKYGLALSYFENKQYSKAKIMLEQLLAADSKNLFYVDALSDVYIKTKDRSLNGPFFIRSILAFLLCV